MEGPNHSADKSESGPRGTNSANTTFSFEMLDMIITGGSHGLSKSQEKETNRKTENITEKGLFGASEERVEISCEAKGKKRKSSIREKTANSYGDAVEFKKQFHNLGKKEKKKKKVYNMNSEVAVGSGSEFPLVGEFLPVEDTPVLASCKGDTPLPSALMDCLSGSNSSGVEHCRMSIESNGHNGTNGQNGNHMNKEDVESQLAKMEQTDEEVLLSGNIDCTNCKYYLKELTSRNYMDFSYMDQYISEGERNLLLLKNKKIEELENENKLMKHSMKNLKEENRCLESKLDKVADSLSDLRSHMDKLMEENKSLKEVNKRLRVNLQKGQSCRKEVEETNRECADKEDASSSARGRQDPRGRDFENSIDNELFNELY
ncbi:hypothetical protein AK88_04609 [Plasmodium fragile]|uniref:Uncharacterized protein n=1 Tax=Plasmodium fragile TaxID=5857 RepID=A0A0D9QFG7_PLAFR|nr:uncharacterized protein AK88_04609 [Plasmodium fragile]KJP85739.1 hypothetical protein AK88_04609 [Plasmodium fragile]